MVSDKTGRLNLNNEIIAIYIYYNYLASLLLFALKIFNLIADWA